MIEAELAALAGLAALRTGGQRRLRHGLEESVAKVATFTTLRRAGHDAVIPFVVIFRMGGTANFTWQRTLPMTQAEAELAAAEIRRGGRPAHPVRAEFSAAIGLPEMFEPEVRVPSQALGENS